MKKLIALASVICLSFSLMAQEDTIVNQNVKGIHPYKLEQNATIKREHSNWSLIPYAGVNWFFGDYSKPEFRTNFYYPTVGLAVEYSFNPAWSLGLEYDFARYRMMGAEPDKGVNVDTMLMGNMHLPHLYLAVDLSNFFYPYGKKKIFSLIGQIGAGAAVYKNSVYYDLAARGKTATATPKAMSDYAFNPFINFGLGLEFNLNRTLALGVRANYALVLNDQVEGRIVGANTDGMLDVSLNMRFKLEGVSKTHARNVAGREFPDQRLITVYEAEGFIRDAAGNLIRVKAENPNSTLIAAAQPVHDTVIIYHDTTVLHTKEVVIENAAAKAASQYYYVYFESGKAEIDNEGLITIQQVADRMEADTALYAVVEGYCDNTGSSAYNYALGDKRAANVMDELREEHAIEPSHLYSGGIGKLIGRRSTASYGPNRRAVIRLVDKETFDRLRGELDERKSQRGNENNGVSFVPLSVSKALGEKKNPFAERNSETVTVDKSTTLSQLARKYYNNTQCWVYIYIANRKVIDNPNALKPGIQLAIPELTAEELKLGKEGCLRLYGMARK